MKATVLLQNVLVTALLMVSQPSATGAEEAPVAGSAWRDDTVACLNIEDPDIGEIEICTVRSGTEPIGGKTIGEWTTSFYYLQGLEEGEDVSSPPAPEGSGWEYLGINLTVSLDDSQSPPTCAFVLNGDYRCSSCEYCDSGHYTANCHNVQLGNFYGTSFVCQSIRPIIFPFSTLPPEEQTISGAETGLCCSDGSPAPHRGEACSDGIRPSAEACRDTPTGGDDVGIDAGELCCSDGTPAVDRGQACSDGNRPSSDACTSDTDQPPPAVPQPEDGVRPEDKVRPEGGVRPEDGRPAAESVDNDGQESGQGAGCADAMLAATKSGPDNKCNDLSLEYAHFWPLGDPTGCHGWRATDDTGKVHDNSANNIRCSDDGQSLLYDQYAASVDCVGTPAAKSFVLGECHQGRPPSLYDTALNLDCCSDPGGDSCQNNFFGQPYASSQKTSDEVIFWNGVECSIAKIQEAVIQLEDELDELLEELEELDAGGEGPAGGISADERCISDIPTSGEKGAVQLAFYKNLAGGVEGEECPSSCVDSENTPITSQWYAIAADIGDQCFQWPGHSGKNSMKEGVCNVDSLAFTYNQFTDCDCGGSAQAKTVYVETCIVDRPSKLCSKVVDFKACTKDQIQGEIVQLEDELDELLEELEELDDASTASALVVAFCAWAAFIWFAWI